MNLIVISTKNNYKVKVQTLQLFHNFLRILKSSKKKYIYSGKKQQLL